MPLPALTLPPASAKRIQPEPSRALTASRRLVLEAEEAEQAKLTEMRRAVQEALRVIVEELNLPTMQRLADALSRQSGVMEDLPKLLNGIGAEVLQAESRTRRMLWRMVGFLTMLVMSLAAFSGWTLWKMRQLPMDQSAMTTETAAQVSRRDVLVTQLGKMEVEMQGLLARRAAVQAQITDMESRAKQSEEMVTRATNLLTAVTEARRQTQQDIAQLQKIAQAFQFRLLEGKDGMVFVEVPETAEPFMHGGKRLIAVTPAAQPQ